MIVQIKNEFNKISIDGSIYGCVEIIRKLDTKKIQLATYIQILKSFTNLLNGKTQGKNKIFVQKAKNIKGKDYALAIFGYHLGRPSDVKNYFKKENIFFFACKLYN